MHFFEVAEYKAKESDQIQGKYTICNELLEKEMLCEDSKMESIT